MSRRAQRWLIWIYIAIVALQIYVVRELLAGLILVGLVFAGASVLVATALIVHAAWRWLKTTAAAAWEVGRPAMAVARALLVDSKS